MISIKNKQDCSGCEACKNVCPNDCIEMMRDEEGFLYPKVNSESCIECNVCNNTCPIFNPPDNESYSHAYAGQIKNEDVRRRSSSGGIFSALAEKIIAEGGSVFGATFDENFGVHHIEVKNTDELDKLRGSKYTQSEIGDTYRQVKEILNDNRKVLFSGTACQIAGLKKYLSRNYNNLYTVDVLCHGVPSPKLWKKYIAEKEKQYGTSVERISFRHKKYGWKIYSVEFLFKNSTEYLMPFGKDPYMRLFLSNISLRPSCYNCRFNKLDRPSDITIGDAWGIDNIHPELDDDKGTSVIMVRGKKGNKLFDAIKDDLLFVQDDVDRLVPPNSGGRKSVKEHGKRERFFKEIDNQDVTDLIKLIKIPLYRKVITKFKTVIWKLFKLIGVDIHRNESA